MSLICPYATLTFFPGEYPSEEDGLVLLGPDHDIEDGSALRSAIRQIIQREPIFRGATPEIYVRGNAALQLTWQEVRKGLRSGEALALGLDLAIDLPNEVGWLKIEIPSEGLIYGVTPAAIELVDTDHDPIGDRTVLTWTLQQGQPFRIATAEDYAITTEDGFAIGLEDGSYLVLETAP